LSPRVVTPCGAQAAAARLWVALGEWNMAVANMIAESMIDDLVGD